MLRRAAILAVALALMSCGRALETTCPSTPARWVVLPESIDVAVGRAMIIEVVEFTCADAHRERVYPPMSVVDTAIAYADNTHRLVSGSSKGVTKLVLTPDGRNGARAVQLPVVVR